MLNAYAKFWANIVIVTCFAIVVGTFIAVYIGFSGIVHKQVYRHNDIIYIAYLGKTCSFPHDYVDTISFEDTDKKDLIRVSITYKNNEFSPEYIVVPSSYKEKIELAIKNPENIENGGVYSEYYDIDLLCGGYITILCMGVIIPLLLVLAVAVNRLSGLEIGK